MRHALETIFHYGPLMFAALFLWPLFAQILMRFGTDLRTATLLGAVALPLGMIAQWRGRWI